MKAQILKLAGVKTEAEFYKKFPTEEAFMKKHGKALKKAQNGVTQPLAFNDLRENALTTLTGYSAADRQRQEDLANKQAELEAMKNQKSSGGFGDMFSNIDPETVKSLASSFGGAKNGKKLKKASNGLGTDTPDTSKSDALKQVASMAIPIAGDIIQGLEAIKQEKIDIGNAQAWAKISGITKDASGIRPEQAKRQYVRPEDQMMPTQNPLGTGTNYLAQNGASIGGNPTEIQNMYNPGDMYAGLGYEPLEDSNPKQYAYGGKLIKAQNGFGNTMKQVGATTDKYSTGIGQTAGYLGSKIGGGSGKIGARGRMAGSLGKKAGQAITMFTGIPGLETIGESAGNFIGSIFDGKSQKKLKTAEDTTNLNVDIAGFQTGAKDIQSQYNTVIRNGGHLQSYEDGGYVSNDWTPQVITTFGEHKLKDLLQPPHDADMLRAGGHLREYTPPSASAMYTGRDLPYQMQDGGQLAMGGDLQVHRGKAETMSYNPYLPGDGETIMFRGPSHDNGGMPVSFGNNGVEVEGGEPAIKMQNGGESDSLTVIGDMYVPNYGVAEIGDDKAKGKKFKHYFTDLSKQEAKQNTIIEKSTALANNADVNDPFDRLSLASANAMQIGADMKLKDIAKKKLDTVAVQNAILDTAKEFGLKSADLAKGKIVKAKANDPYAQNGKEVGNMLDEEIVIQNPNVKAKRPNYTDLKSLSLKAPQMLPVGSMDPSAAMNKSIGGNSFGEVPKRTDWSWLGQLGEDALSTADSIIPNLLAPTKLELSPAEYSAEMDALATNQLQPVFAQGYNPLLAQSFKISLQNQRNDIISQARAAERMSPYNPAAASTIFGQVRDAMDKINYEEQRLNQAEQVRVTEANRATLNDAAVRNLGIFDQQQVRQSEAQSKTDAIRRKAKQSIADKITQNKLENAALNIQENLYKYRFNKNGVAYNINAPKFFEPSPNAGASTSDYSGLVAPEGKEWTYRNVDGKQVPYDLITKKEDKKEDKKKKRNGDIVKAIKNL